MRKYILMIALAALTLTGCHKRADTFAFKGKVVGYCDCTLATASISEMDFGYVVALDTPDSVGGAYVANGTTYKNAVLIYRTKSRFGDGDSISGTMYLDDDYSRAYCQYHFNLGIPEGVCYTLD